MTNEEMLERLKKCFTNYRFPGGYQELALTNEKELNSLVIDLLKDVRREKQFEKTRKRYMKYYKASTYGIGGFDAFKLASFKTNPLKQADDDFVEPYAIDDVKRTITALAAAKRATEKDIKPKVMFSGPATIFQYGDFKTVVKCDEEDKFDRLVGLGVALYRYYRQHKDYKKQYQTLSYVMNLDELARYAYALHQFCGWNVNKKRNLAKELKKHDEGTWITLDI